MEASLGKRLVSPILAIITGNSGGSKPFNCSQRLRYGIEFPGCNLNQAGLSAALEVSNVLECEGVSAISTASDILRFEAVSP